MYTMYRLHAATSVVARLPKRTRKPAGVRIHTACIDIKVNHTSILIFFIKNICLL